MLSTLRNAWKIDDLRKRLIFTVLMVAVLRLGNFIPVPGIDSSVLQDLAKNQTMFNFYDMISGGAFSKFSIFAIGVFPYINASIIVQLLTIAIPRLEQLSKEGEDGRKKLNNITRYSAVGLAALQAFGTYALLANQHALKDPSKLNLFLIILTLTTASTFLVWLGDQITVKGIGNGISLLIFVNIISRMPTMFYQVGTASANIVEVVMFIVFFLALLLSVIIMSLSERRIPVQYAGKTVGNKTFKGQSTHIPINLNASGVIAIIFAMSVMQFPKIISEFWPNGAITKVILTSKFSPFKESSLQYLVIYFFMVIFFTWFYTGVTFKPDEMAENMHKSSGFIPGIRPGEPTAKHIGSILDRISIIGGLFAGIIAISPMIIDNYTKFKGIQFGGTSLLIVVGVAVEAVRVLESQLIMRHYQGFLK
jgi:preprotein translocase subunit SecY